METTQPHPTDLTREELELRLLDAENRTGLSTDIRAFVVNGEKTNIARHNILADPPGKLKLVIVGDAPPADTSLDFAGTAYIENEKRIVGIYR